MIQLYQQFKLFSPTQLIGVANDQTPHYFKLSRQFAKVNPGSMIGQPGKMQVFSAHLSLNEIFA